MSQAVEKITLHDYQPQLASFRQEVLAGLAMPRKQFPPTFLFYDKRGSDLFIDICSTSEYYVTRTEVKILQQNNAEIAEYIGDRALLIEYGSGSSPKIHALLDALHAPVAYMPIDIEKAHLLDAAEKISHKYPNLDVVAIVADYTKQLHLPQIEGAHQKVVFFAGGTIGNLNPKQAIALLSQARQLVAPAGGMLVGVDLKKDPNRLHAAYNDAQGITAEFNLNILANINRELNANFDLDCFSHYAFYNPTEGRIEMHLVSLKAQTVIVAGQEFAFKAGESIHTENSYKYSLDDFKYVAQAAGFTLRKTWLDQNRLFSVHYLSASD
ncbi:methyltransferase [Thalassoporum mexicanum PCC 7367]|uniref:L-histidine N(alpha)-methyltransferase n=1 Tax=Thalassoporum mexicanum TaxID=3457544 RepID=UPI00029FB28F|nr:L-histidine N(alpha)-methyltransferase [Pseudanabaena sp. PCC 7367]AFY69513.1 methyltransferase [Pseudanabaena sp. PCC 7367]